MSIALISVYSQDQMMQEYYNIFLYGLLAEREPYQNISHKEMPTFENHVKFVKSKPYKEWFVIYDRDQKKNVGSVYLSKNNEVGLFISKGQRKKNFGRTALKELMEYFRYVREFKANIAQNNSTSICFFVNLGFKYENTLLENGAEINGQNELIVPEKENIIQYTYRMTNPYYVELSQEAVEA